MDINNVSNRYPKYELKDEKKKDDSIIDLLKPKKVEDKNEGSMVASIVKRNLKSQDLASKVARGERLTQEELRYLKMKNPDILRKAVDANNKRKNLEMELRFAKTDEEAVEILKRAKQNALSYANGRDDGCINSGKLQLEAIEKAKKKNNINTLV